MRSRPFAILALALTTSAVGCTKIENVIARVPFLAFMHSSPAFDPYEAPRPAPENAVPFLSPLGDAPHAEGNAQTALLELAGRVTNPIQADSASMADGAVLYARFCAVCHGPQGAGDGTILGPDRFPFAPALTTPVVDGYSDGYVYAVIRQGRGLMPAYGPRMTERQRWLIVNYVRALGQGGAQGTPAAAAGTAAQGTDGAAATAAPAGAATTQR